MEASKTKWWIYGLGFVAVLYFLGSRGARQ